MISLYSGTPGSGKTLHTAKEIISRIRKSSSVTIGNFLINVGQIEKRKGIYIYLPNHRITPSRLIDFSMRYSRHLKRRLREGELLLIIDEAQLLFNPREWNRSDRRDWLSFFSQHRHLGYDIILISQHDRMLDRQVRSLLEYEVIHRNIKHAGNIGFILSLFTNCNLFYHVTYWYPIREPMNSSFFLGRKKLYSIYDSYNYYL